MTAKKSCKKYSSSVTNPERELKKIQIFCSLLKANKVKDSKAAFLNLKPLTQCLFINHAWDIFNDEQKRTDERYMIAFLFFKLFRGKDLKEQKIYEEQTSDKKKALEEYYKKALHWNREKKGIKTKPRSSSGKSPSKSPSGRTPLRKSKKVFDKKYQKHLEPEGPNDPLKIFYTSLLEEKPSSLLAIKWLTEYGVFEGDQRKKLEKLYLKVFQKE